MATYSTKDFTFTITKTYSSKQLLVLCITESIVIANVLGQRLIWQAQTSVPSHPKSSLIINPFLSLFLPTYTLWKLSFLKSYYCCSSNIKRGKDIADEIPVKPSHKDQKTDDKKAKSTEAVFHKAGEDKWKYKECQRMFRKAAVYQGCEREQLAIKSWTISFQRQMPYIPFSFPYFVFQIFNFVVSFDLNISTYNSTDVSFDCKKTANTKYSNALGIQELLKSHTASPMSLPHAGTLLCVIYFLCTVYEALTFPTCSCALSFSNLFPVVFSVLPWWLHSRHLVFWLMRGKSSWLNNWKSSSWLSSESVCLPMQILILMICAFCHS